MSGAMQLGLALRRQVASGALRYVNSRRALAGKEHAMQAAWADALAKLIAPPGVASPDGVVWWSVDIADARNAIVGAMRKKRGVIAAIPDMVFHWPRGHVGYVEAKTATGRLSRTRTIRRKVRGSVRLIEFRGQEELHAELAAAGIPVIVPHDLDELLLGLRAWGVPMRGCAA